jgi:hypothetical protein
LDDLFFRGFSSLDTSKELINPMLIDLAYGRAKGSMQNEFAGNTVQANRVASMPG